MKLFAKRRVFDGHNSWWYRLTGIILVTLLWGRTHEYGWFWLDHPQNGKAFHMYFGKLRFDVHWATPKSYQYDMRTSTQ